MYSLCLVLIDVGKGASYVTLQCGSQVSQTDVAKGFRPTHIVIEPKTSRILLEAKL